MTTTTDTPVARAIDAWKKAAHRLVWLASGTWAEIVLPSALELAARGVLDDELREVAIRSAVTGVDLDKIDPEDLVRYEKLRRILIARMVKRVTADGAVDEDPERLGYPIGWPDCMVAVEIDPDDLFDFGQDTGQLKAIADRAVSVELVTLRTRKMRAALLHGTELERVVADDVATESEAVDELVAARSFRREPASGQRDSDGGPALEDAPVDAPGDN